MIGKCLIIRMDSAALQVDPAAYSRQLYIAPLSPESKEEAEDQTGRLVASEQRAFEFLRSRRAHISLEAGRGDLVFESDDPEIISKLSSCFQDAASWLREFGDKKAPDCPIEFFQPREVMAIDTLGMVSELDIVYLPGITDKSEIDSTVESVKAEDKEKAIKFLEGHRVAVRMFNDYYDIESWFETGNPADLDEMASFLSRCALWLNEGKEVTLKDARGLLVSTSSISAEVRSLLEHGASIPKETVYDVLSDIEEAQQRLCNARRTLRKFVCHKKRRGNVPAFE